MAESIDPNIPSGLSKLLSQGDTALNDGQTEQAAIMYCKAYAWDSCVTQTHLSTLSHESFQTFVSVLEDYCLWGFDTGRHFPMYNINLTIEELCDWLTQCNMKPNSLVAWATKVNIQMHKNCFADVIESCGHVIQFVSNKEASFVLARAAAHLTLGHDNDAVLDYLTAYAINSRATKDYIQERQSKNITHIVGICCKFAENLEHAQNDVDTNLRLIECYKFMLMLQPADVTSCLRCVAVLLKMNKSKEAVVLLSEVMEVVQDKDVMYVAVQRAEIYLTIGETELALHDYLTASRTDQQFAQSALHLLPQETQIKITEQAKCFADNILVQYRDQCKACSIHTQIGNDQLSLACDCYSLLLLVDSTNIQVLLNSAECFLHQGMKSKAIEVYSQAVTVSPKSTNIYCHRGLCFISMDDLESALRDYNCAVGINPRDPRALCGKFATLVLMGHFEQGVDVLTKLVDRNGLQVVVDNIREFCFQDNGFCRRLTMLLKTSLETADVEDREESLCIVGQLLTRLFPHDLNSHVVYAEVLLLFHRNDESQSILVRFVNNNPSNSSSSVYLALLKMRLGKTSIAIRELSTILRTVSEAQLREMLKEIDPKVLRVLAREAYMEGIMKTMNTSERIVVFTLAIVANPSQAWKCYFQRGKQHFLIGNLDQAIVDLTCALNINSRHIPSHLMRALVLIRQKAWQQSVNDLLAAFQIDSEVLVRLIQDLPRQTKNDLLDVLFTCVQNYFGVFYSSGVISELLLPLCLLLVQSDSSVAVYHSTLADAYFVLGNYKEAIKELEIIEHLSPSLDTFVVGQLGLANVKLSHFSTAASFFSKMCQLDPEGLEVFLETLNTEQCQTLTQQALNQANDLLSCSNFKDALSFLNLAVFATKSQRSDVLRKRSECWIGLQFFSNAFDDITKVIDSGSVLITDYCLRANVGAQLGESARACADVMKAMDMDEKAALDTLKKKYPDVQLESLFVKTALDQLSNKMYRQAWKTRAYGLRCDPGNEELRSMKDKLEFSRHSCILQ